MIRSRQERVDAVRAVGDAARRVTAARDRLVPDLVRTTGLSAEGVELALTEHVEAEPTEADLHLLVERTPETTRVLVVSSAQVFVGALRAIALARAASGDVVVRPSRREPVYARALVEALADPSVRINDTAPSALTEGEIHVYGRDATIAAIREQARPDVLVRGHGTGLGVAVVSPSVPAEEAAAAVARDVVPFDQRGCLSPRIVLVVGDDARARELAVALDAALSGFDERVPRGQLSDDERAEAKRYVETLAFAGAVREGAGHVVGCALERAALLVPPAGRHVHVAAVSDQQEARRKIAPLARFVVAIGTDDPVRWGASIVPDARISPLGSMQRPPLDGPVDMRPAAVSLRGQRAETKDGVVQRGR